MKKIPLLFSILLASCSHHYSKSRLPASKHGEEAYEIRVSTNREAVFSNGADSVPLNVKFFQNGQEVQVDPKEIKLLGDKEFEQTDFKYKNKVYEALIRPKIRSGDIRLIVAYKEAHISKEIGIKTYLTPLKEKLETVPWQPSSSIFVSGLSYQKDENVLPEQFNGFGLSNLGNNKIVNTSASKHSSRSFTFEFEQSATQNVSLLVNDSPNEFTSHGMYSHFMFFPRSFLPRAEIIGNKEVEVTLPTGETVSFDYKSGEILGGVFAEGPVDIGGDRFKRRYADLRYQGKGILLRANARGQMPQQGQFENTKIDLNYGTVGSAEVLILNGSTGERCRRPKSDFWSSADVQTILFKFPSDKEFDAYLRSKCKFGIPDLVNDDTPEQEDSKALAEGIWDSCLSPEKSRVTKENFLLNLKQDYIRGDIRSCLNERISLLESKELQREVAFEAYYLYRSDREKEILEIGPLLEKHEKSLEISLYRNVSWIQDASLKSLESECKLESRKTEFPAMKFYDARKDLNYQKVCLNIREKVESHLKESVSLLKKKFINNPENFKKIKSLSKFTEECSIIVPSLIDSSFDFSSNKKLYSESISLACEEVKATSEYNDWLSSSEEGMAEELLEVSLIKLEEEALKKAESCLVDYPVDNALNRIRFKAKRESCLVDSWAQVEEAAILASFKSKNFPLNQKIKSILLERLQTEARRLQIKMIKEKF